MFEQPSLKAHNALCTKEQFLNDKANPVISDNKLIRLQHCNMQGLQNNNKKIFYCKVYWRNAGLSFSLARLLTYMYRGPEGNFNKFSYLPSVLALYFLLSTVQPSALNQRLHFLRLQCQLSLVDHHEDVLS